MAPDRQAWLSLTPEPEGELPPALATLRAGRPAGTELVRAERGRAERLVARARRRAYRRWLAEARALAARPPAADPQVEAAAALTRDVLRNHDALARGLEPRGRGEGARG